MTTTAHTAPARPARARTIVLWTAQILLAAFYAFVSVPKLTGDPLVAEMMSVLGLSAWVGYAIGAAELAGAVGLLIPRLSALAAIGLSALMIGATVCNLILLSPASAAMTLALTGVFAVIAWARRDSLSKLIKR